MDRAALKSAAKQQIRGKIGVLFIITLIIAIISVGANLILGLIPVVGSIIASFIITPAFTLSITRVYLNMINGYEPSVGDAFSGFDDFWSAFKVNFLVGLFTFLWSLLLIIPGFVKSFAYSMSIYILAENKGKAALECINESKAITNGHKMELFVLGLSFIGWILLVLVTFGIAAIWVAPYIQATMANAYRSLKPVQVNAEIEGE